MFIARLTSTHLDLETLTQKYYFYLKGDNVNFFPFVTAVSVFG